jgi:hypothetical protein
MSALPNLPAGTVTVVTVQILTPHANGALVVSHSSAGTISRDHVVGGAAIVRQVGELATIVTRDALMEKPAASLHMAEPSRG